MIGALVFWLIILGLAAICGCGYSGDDVPRPYYFRRCEGRRWKKQFPEVPKEEIRRFLSIFVDAFGFREKDRLKFGPDDRIGDVYKAVYGPHPFCDGLEITSLFCDVEDTYSVDLEDGNAMDMTLGALFRSAIESKR